MIEFIIHNLYVKIIMYIYRYYKSGASCTLHVNIKLPFGLIININVKGIRLQKQPPIKFMVVI